MDIEMPEKLSDSDTNSEESPTNLKDRYLTGREEDREDKYPTVCVEDLLLRADEHFVDDGRNTNKRRCYSDGHMHFSLLLPLKETNNGVPGEICEIQTQTSLVEHRKDLRKEKTTSRRKRKLPKNACVIFTILLVTAFIAILGLILWFVIEKSHKERLNEV